MPNGRGVAAAIAVCATAVWLAAPFGRTAKGEDLDLQRIFRCVASDAASRSACDRARETIMFNCTVCHLFVRIVHKQDDAAGWDGTLARHRARVPQLTDEQFRAVRDYLVGNFRPDLEPPMLPDSLADQY